jgi:hypothetical protein
MVDGYHDKPEGYSEVHMQSFLVLTRKKNRLFIQAYPFVSRRKIELQIAMQTYRSLYYKRMVRGSCLKRNGEGFKCIVLACIFSPPPFITHLYSTHRYRTTALQAHAHLLSSGALG